MDVTQKELVPGVELISVSTDKFKTGTLSVSLISPLRRETVTANALLLDVLYRGSGKYPDIQAISEAEDELYGLSLSPVVRQRGETQCMSLVGSFIDDSFALDGTAVLEGAAELMGEILLRPATEGGVFRADYVRSEGMNLADLIRSQVNDKRTWAIRRLTEVMCEGEPYALDRHGFAEEAERMDPAVLWDRYQALLREAGVVFCYVGAAAPKRVEKAIRAAFAPLLTPRSRVLLEHTVIPAPKGEVREQTDHLDVAQGKLALGLRCGGIDLRSPEYPALLVCNAVYGGTPNAKLFMNVREKLSLCYFASSMVNKYKSVMVVCSGVEFANFQVAKDEILAQLDKMRAGDFTDEELHAGKQALTSGYRALLDSQGQVEDFWFSQAVAGTDESPEGLSARVAAVTREQVAACARKLALDTVYYLAGKEG